MILVLPVPPSANHRLRAVGGRLRLSESARQYKDTVYGAFLRQVQPPFPVFKTERLEVHVWWYYGKHGGDADNRQKSLFDALQHLAYQNDSQIRRFHVSLAEDDENPHVLLHLRPM